MKLHISTTPNEAGCLVAAVPALPGRLSQSAAREDALSYIAEAIEGRLEVVEERRRCL